jgi:hypothetical protein
MDQWETVAVTDLLEGDTIRHDLGHGVETAFVDRPPRVGEQGVYVRLVEHGTTNLRGSAASDQVERKVRRR